MSIGPIPSSSATAYGIAQATNNAGADSQLNITPQSGAPTTVSGPSENNQANIDSMQSPASGDGKPTGGF